MADYRTRVEAELHTVSKSLTKATCHFFAMDEKGAHVRMVVVLDAIRQNPHLYSTAFQQWSSALIRMSLKAVRLRLT